MILFWELSNVYRTMQCASLDCGKKSLKVYRVRRVTMDSVFYMLVNRHEGWEGRGPVLKIHASRSTRFLTWRHLKVYLHGIMYKTKLLSNGCKQQIDNKYMKKAGHYLYCKFNGVFLDEILVHVLLYNPDGVQSCFCYISLIFIHSFVSWRNM